MLLSIKHVTEYIYETPVEFALQRVKLRPLDSPVAVRRRTAVVRPRI